MNSPLESRAAGSIYGKCDNRIDIPVPEALDEAIITLARMSSMTKAEYTRLVLERHCFGAAPQIQHRDPLLRA